MERRQHQGRRNDQPGEGYRAEPSRAMDTEKVAKYSPWPHPTQLDPGSQQRPNLKLQLMADPPEALSAVACQPERRPG